MKTINEVEVMRTFLRFGIMFVVSLIFTCAVSAGQVTDENSPGENPWNGTWTSGYYTIVIQENETGISGWYEPFDIDTYDPGMLTGSLSDDKKIFSGKWIESGPNTLYLSDDNMSHSGTGGVYLEGMEQPYSYSMEWDRVGAQLDPDNPWSGSWENDEAMETMIQNGTSVTSTYFQKLTEEDEGDESDEPGIFEGTVTEGGRTLTGFWPETGNFTFILSEDGNFWTGTDNLDFSKFIVTDTWNATKIQ